MNNTTTHKHREIANHSPGQQRMFFALGQELGHAAEDLKERAKAHFKLSCFNDLTKSNMMFLIDQLDKQKSERFRIMMKEKSEMEEKEKAMTPEERQKAAEEENRKMLDNL